MSTTIDQKAYLQKYLGRPSGDKKKKKKKLTKGKGFKIIDDDIDLTKLRPLDGDELDILDQGEDAPQIAGIIDERPEDMKKLEQFKTSSKWRVVNQDDGFNSKLQIEEIKTDIKEIEKENEIIFGKMYSDTEDEKNDSDLSPPRRKADGNKVTKQDSDGDLSPPRRKPGGSKTTKASKKVSDSDISPPRRKSEGSKSKVSKKDSDDDISPPRRGKSSPTRNNNSKSNDKERTRIRKPSRWGDDNNTGKEADKSKDGKRKSKGNSPKLYQSKSDSDESPPRKSRKNHDSDISPPRKSKTNYDSDLSPPRKSTKHAPPRKNESHTSKRHLKSPSPRRKSPQQSSKHKNSQNSKSRRNSSDSDLSPPRKNKRQSSPEKMALRNKRQSRSPAKRSRENKRYNDDSDQSPPRKDKDKRRKDSPPKKMARTLDGKMAGLQDARQLRHENEAFRRKEDDVFHKMSDEVSGRNAKAVSRKGKRETSAEKEQLREKAERQKVLDEKYKKWSKGIKQLEAQEARMQDFLHEASKPLARHKDDRDLEHNLKGIERDGDPMLQYIRERKRERGELGPEKPTYKGSFPPNRFNIRPGYRWDGVDRSNGYEKKYFETQSKKKALEEEAYKWSTEDL